MADFTALKTAIQTYIKQNGNEEITGAILQEILLSVVTTLGDSAINDLVTALGNEVTARQNADATLQNNIDGEATTRGNADTALQTAINDEARTRANADGTLQGAINGITAMIENGYVYAGIATPSTTPATGKVFYLALTAGTYTNFGSTEVSQGINILKYNGSAWSLDAFIGIDDTPTPNSPKLVKSGGAFESVMANGSAFDISAHFASGGTLATYADLSAALNALDTLSASYKRGGMSIKFVQSSDNKYVQYLYHGTSTSVAAFTNTDNWEKTNLEEELNQVRQEIGDFSKSVKHARIFNGSWIRESDETAFIIPVKAGDIVRVKQNPDNADCYWGFLANYSDTDTSPNWATGSSGNGWSFADYTATAPSNAKYLYLCYIINGTDRTPSIATINGFSILEGNYIKDIYKLIPGGAS